MNRLTWAINHAGTIALNSALVLRTPVNARSWQIRTLRVVFLPGQAGSLFVRPQAEDISGSRNDLLLPSPEVTGDDWVAYYHDIPFRFDAGSFVRFELRNTSLRHFRRFGIQVILEEVDA